MNSRSRFLRAVALTAAVLVVMLALIPGAGADSTAIDFESYALGNVHGQDGWSKTGGYDVAVVDQSDLGLSYPGFGDRSLRISNAVTSGSFGDHAFSKSLVNEAGETTAANGGMSGGARQAYYEAQWDFASVVPGAEQVGLSTVASPDRGDGARMSWVQMMDTPTGLRVNFQDYTSATPGTCDGSFLVSPVASNLDRTVKHTIRITMEFYDGTANDVVKVYVDGVLGYTGTSWEDYFRDCQPPESRTVDSILFRVGGTNAPSTSGKGFLIDNFSQFSGPIMCTTVCYVDDGGSDANGGTSPADALKTIQKGIDTVAGGGTVIVKAGTYFENAATGWKELSITKSMTLRGEGSGATVITLPQKTNGLEISGSGLVVTLEGLTFTKLPADPYAADFNIRVAETASTFSSLTFRDVESAYAKGRNVILGGAGTYDEVLVEDSNFHHAGSWGFSIAGTASNVTVTGSHFDDNGLVDAAHGIGFDLEAAGGVNHVRVSDSTFSNNTQKGVNLLKTTDAIFEGITATGNHQSFVLWEWAGNSSDIQLLNSNLSGNRNASVLIGSETGKTVANVSITGNNLSNNSASGVYIYREAGWGEGVVSNVDINRNNLSGNPFRGVGLAKPYETVDATCNWWGAPGGPGVAGSSSADSGATTVPWLISNNLNGLCDIAGTLFNGFFQPIDMLAMNMAKAGQAIPVKWQLTGGSALASDPASFVGLFSQKVSCTSTEVEGTDAIENYSGGSGLQYLGDGNWQYNWKTPRSYAGTGCRAMWVEFSDGSTSPVAYFRFR